MTSVKPISDAGPAEPRAAAAIDRGFSLGALFLLTAAAAVLLAGAAPVVRMALLGQVELIEMLAASLATMCGGAVLGLALGMHRYQRLRGAIMGAPLGAAIGLVAGPLCVLPAKLLWPVALSMFVGCVMLTAASVLMRPRVTTAQADRRPAEPAARR